MDIKQALARLNALGYRVTRQRRLVLEVIRANPCLQNVDDIFTQCRGRDESISYPTIYRTLDMLVEAGMARRTHFQGKNWYEGVMSSHHHHFVCTECGATVALAVCPLDFLKEDLRAAQFEVHEHQFELLGICKDCQSNQPKGGVLL